MEPPLLSLLINFITAMRFPFVIIEEGDIYPDSDTLSTAGSTFPPLGQISIDQHGVYHVRWPHPFIRNCYTDDESDSDNPEDNKYGEQRLGASTPVSAG